MKMTNEELLGFYQVLGRWRDRDDTPSKLSWKFVLNEKLFKPFGEAFDQHMADLRTKYAAKDDEGNLKEVPPGEDGSEGGVQIEPDGVEKMQEEMQAILKETFEVSPVMLSFTDFPESLSVSPRDMARLAPLIEG